MSRPAPGSSMIPILPTRIANAPTRRERCSAQPRRRSDSRRGRSAASRSRLSIFAHPGWPRRVTLTIRRLVREHDQKARPDHAAKNRAHGHETQEHEHAAITLEARSLKHLCPNHSGPDAERAADKGAEKETETSAERALHEPPSADGGERSGYPACHFTGTHISKPPAPVRESNFSSYLSRRSGMSPCFNPAAGNASAKIASIVAAMVVIWPPCAKTAQRCAGSLIPVKPSSRSERSETSTPAR